MFCVLSEFASISYKRSDHSIVALITKLYECFDHLITVLSIQWKRYLFVLPKLLISIYNLPDKWVLTFIMDNFLKKTLNSILI